MSLSVFALLVGSAAALVVGVVLRAALSWLRGHLRLRRIMAKLPGPPALPIVGNMLAFTGDLDDLYDKMMGITREYGDIFRLWAFGHAVVFVSDPRDVEAVLVGKEFLKKSEFYSIIENFIGKGLLTLTGSDWRRHRKAITPSMHLDILKDFLEVFHKNSLWLVDQFEGLADGTSVFNVEDMCGQLANWNVCATIMDTEMDGSGSDSDSLGSKDLCKVQFLEALSKSNDLFVYRTVRPWYISDTTFKLSRRYGEYLETVDTLRTLPRAIIAKKKQAMAEAPTEAAVVTKRKAFLDHALSSAGSMITSDELADEVNTLIAAGSDTSMRTLSLVLFVLSLRPDIQAEVHKELDAIFGDDVHRAIEPTDLSHMVYLDRVLKEVLRYFSVVPMMARDCSADCMLPSGHLVPKGAIVALWTPAVHKDPRSFVDPESFDPDRFLPENTRGRHPFSYIPFSAGLRNCIGQRYATMFIKSTAANLARRLHFLPDPCGPQRLEDVRLKTRITVSPRDGVRLRVEKRLL